MTVTVRTPLGQPLARPRRRPLRTACDRLGTVARRLFAAAVNRLDVTVHVGDETIGRGGPAMTVHRPEEFFARLGRHQLIGFGEAYLTGAWDTERPEDLGAFLTVLAAEMPTLVPERLQALRGLVVKRPPRRERSSTKNSRRQHRAPLRPLQRPVRAVPRPVAELLVGPVPRAPARRTRAGPSDLQPAQLAKIDRLLDQAGVGEGSRVLEIGSGWGELAIRAARRGATVRTITLSVEQKALAEARIAEAARESGSARPGLRRAVRLPRHGPAAASSTTPSSRSR